MPGANISCVKSNTVQLRTPRRKQKCYADTNEEKKNREFFKSGTTFFTFFKFHTRKANGMRHDLLANLLHLHLPLVTLPLFRTLNDYKHVLLSFNNSGWMQGEFIGYHEYTEQTNVHLLKILRKYQYFVWHLRGDINRCGIEWTACSQVDLETPISCVASKIVTFSSTYINSVVGIIGLISALKILVRHFTMQCNFLLLI